MLALLSRQGNNGYSIPGGVVDGNDMFAVPSIGAVQRRGLLPHIDQVYTFVPIFRERTLAYITGLANVRDAIPFPRARETRGIDRDYFVEALGRRARRVTNRIRSPR
jgi:hypothetical protein